MDAAPVVSGLGDVLSGEEQRLNGPAVFSPPASFHITADCLWPELHEKPQCKAASDGSVTPG